MRSGVNVTVSLISHGHGSDVLVLLRELGELGALGAKHPSALRRVVLTLNCPEPALLAQVRQQTFPFELVLCENDRPVGFGANHNRAFARDASMGASQAFAVFNPDLRLRGDPIASMVKALQERPSVGAVYPRQVDSAGAPSDSERLVPSPRRLLARYLGTKPRPPEVPSGGTPDWVNAACLLVRREAYEQIGGFDERYHMYCEDVDFCLRLQLAGWALVRAEDTWIEHAAQRASHRKIRHLVWHLSSLGRLWRSEVYRDWMSRRDKR